MASDRPKARSSATNAAIAEALSANPEIAAGRRSWIARRAAFARWRRWDDYLNTFDNHEPGRGFVWIVDRIEDDADYWRLLREVWVMTDYPHHHIRVWRALFSSERPGRKHLMDSDPEGRAAWAALPDEITAFPGFRQEGGHRGLSWTTDRARAEWFARRFSFAGTAMLATVRVPRSAIVAAFGGRKESDVVIVDAPEPVMIESIEEDR
jgi:hypothetical protein